MQLFRRKTFSFVLDRPPVEAGNRPEGAKTTTGRRRLDTGVCNYRDDPHTGSILGRDGSSAIDKAQDFQLISTQNGQVSVSFNLRNLNQFKEDLPREATRVPSSGWVKIRGRRCSSSLGRKVSDKRQNRRSWSSDSCPPGSCCIIEFQ